MSDYENDDDEYDDNDEYKNEYEENLNENDEINDEIENFFKAAKKTNNKLEAIDNYNMVIEMEMSNSKSRNLSFQSYEALCLIYIQLKDIDKFSNAFSQIQLLISSSLENFEEKYILQSIKNIFNELDKFKISEYNYKEAFINLIYNIVVKKNIKQFYKPLEDYINNKEEFSFLTEKNKIIVNIIFPIIPILDLKKIITQDKLIKTLEIKDLQKCIIVPLSIDRFIFYLETIYYKIISVTNKNYLTNEIIINSPYKCFEIKKLINNDIALCLEKESKIIRCNLQDNTYEIIQIFETPNFPCYTYCEELSKNKIAFGYKLLGFSIWNKINENNYQCVLIYNIKQRTIFPIDDKTFLLYSFHEKTFSCEIELRFYELESLNFFGKVFLNLGNILYKGSFYKINQRELSYLKLKYLKKYILLIGCQDSIWIINLKNLEILYNTELLRGIKDLIVLKDESFIVLYEQKTIIYPNDQIEPINTSYENYYFNGKDLLKRWEGITNSIYFSIFDDFDFAFLVYSIISKIEIQQMKFQLKENEMENINDEY